MDYELRQELIVILQKLPLSNLPEASISTFFNSGGTIFHENDENIELYQQNVLNVITIKRLRVLDRIILKYLDVHRQRRQHQDKNSQENSEISELWQYLASNNAIDTILGDEVTREHSEAVYKSLLALLASIINIRETYPDVGSSANRNVPMDVIPKAIIASKIYLNWLQVPGGSAYGLFMPFVFGQVLHIAKMYAKTLMPVTNRKVPNEELYSNETQIQKFGIQLLDLIVVFLGRFSLCSSREAIIGVIDLAHTLQLLSASVAVRQSESSETLATRSRQLILSLLDGSHGELLNIARMIIHAFLPGVTYRDSTALEEKFALKFHRASTEAISIVLQAVRGASNSGTSQDRNSILVEDDKSLFMLAVLQNLCIQAPERAEERGRVLVYTFQLAVNENNASVTDNHWIKFIEFLVQLSRHSKAAYRQFAVEFVGKLLSERNGAAPTWKMNDLDTSTLVHDYTPEEQLYIGVGPLLDLLIDRSLDKIATVRAKAITGLSSALAIGLNPESITVESSKTPSEEMTRALRRVLYKPCGSSGASRHENVLRQLVNLFRLAVGDEKTYVRKAAVHALESLLSGHSGTLLPTSMRKDLFELHSRCTDKSMTVRMQAIKALSTIVLKFPNDHEAQKLWCLGVLPLCGDPEANVQKCCLEYTKIVLFDRILLSQSLTDQNAAVWALAAQLDGVLVRCAQTCLRLLIKEQKLEMSSLIHQCIFAIKRSLELSIIQNEMNDEDIEKSKNEISSDDKGKQYWGFSWILLEELAKSGHLIEAAKGQHKNLGIVIECWTKLQSKQLPTSFADGSKRILKVIGALAPVIDAEDARLLADGILESLHQFRMPLNVIGDAVIALSCVCQAKAKTTELGRTINLNWGQTLMERCETSLRSFVTDSTNATEILESVQLIQKQLITVGEISLLDFHKDEDRKLVSIETMKTIIQLYLTPELITTSELRLPTPIRVCSFGVLGKFCLRDQEFAQSMLTLLIRELRTNESQEIRSNVLLILGDLCIRYPSLVDAYMSTIALSMIDSSRLVRRHSLLLFSQLILQDYIKWRDSLLRFFLRTVVDEDRELSNLARHVLYGPLRQKSPHIFTNKFVEMIFVFNNCHQKLLLVEPYEKEGVLELAIPGNAKFTQRSQLYKFLLTNMSDEEKLQMIIKLSTDIFEEVNEGKLVLCDNPADITDNSIEAVLKDTFAVLCSPDIKLSSGKEDDNADLELGEIELQLELPSKTNRSKQEMVASKIAAAKGKLLKKMSKKAMLENIVPVLIGLKRRFASKRSPLMKYLLHYIGELSKIYKKEVKEILSEDPQLEMEIEYDLRQYEAQRQELELEQMKKSGSNINTISKSRSNKDEDLSDHNEYDNAESIADSVAELQLTPKTKQRQRSLPLGLSSSHTEAMLVDTPLRVLHNRSIIDERYSAESSSEDEVVIKKKERKKKKKQSLLFVISEGNLHGKSKKGSKKWNVKAKSPVIGSNEKDSKVPRRKNQEFTQEDLEESMERNLMDAFDSADGEASDDNNDLDNIQSISEDDDVLLSLKKKSKKSRKETAKAKEHQKRKRMD